MRKDWKPYESQIAAAKRAERKFKPNDRVKVCSTTHAANGCAGTVIKWNGESSFTNWWMVKLDGRRGSSAFTDAELVLVSDDPATPPRVERPFVEQEPKFKVGDKVRLLHDATSFLTRGTVGTIEEIRENKPEGIIVYLFVHGHAPKTLVFEDALELVEEPAPDAPKFKVGQRVRIIALGWNAFKEGTVFRMPEDSESGYIQVKDSEGTGSPYNFLAEELEAIPELPAPGAFLSADEDRELVAMGREIWSDDSKVGFLGLVPIGSIANDKTIKVRHTGTGEGNWESAFAPTPDNPEHLTDAARALLRRVRDERKQAANG